MHVTTIVILIIALLAPWVVHLAPPRQRPLALVCAIGLLLIIGIFLENPLSSWAFWVGLVIGIGSVVIVARRGVKLPLRRRGRGRRDHDAPPFDDETLHGD
jgi:hypothetical protein